MWQRPGQRRPGSGEVPAGQEVQGVLAATAGVTYAPLLLCVWLHGPTPTNSAALEPAHLLAPAACSKSLLKGGVSACGQPAKC